MARDDYFRRRASSERHLNDLNDAIHPSLAAFENLTTNFSFGSRTTAVFDEFNEKIAKASKNIEATLENLGAVFKATGVQLKDASQGYWSYLKGTNFGRSFGLKPEGGGGIEEFAGAFGRFLASRSISGPANYLFESAKNPLRDNFEVNRAQQTANSAINTLATTGSVTHALIAGITSWATANLMHDREMKTASYNFEQRSLDTKRGVAEQGSDWAFQKITGMYSRGEQIRMYAERAKVRRGELAYDTDAMVAPKPAAPAASAAPAGTSAPTTAGSSASAGQAAGQGAAQTTQPFQVPGLPTNLLGSQALAALNGPEPVSPLASPEVEQKAETARKAAVDAGVKAAESRKEAADEEQKASEKRKSSVSKEIEELSKREKALQTEIQAHDKKYAGGELPLEERVKAERLESKYQHELNAVHKRQDEIRQGSLAKHGFWTDDKGKTHEWTEQDQLRKREDAAQAGLEQVAALRAAPNEKRGALVNELADVQEQKQVLEAQEKQELDAEEKKKRRENEARERRREWRRQRNLDPDTGASLVKPEPEEKTLGESNGAVNAAAEKVKGAEQTQATAKATTAQVEASAQKAQQAIQAAADGATKEKDIYSYPLPTIAFSGALKQQREAAEERALDKQFGSQLNADYMAKIGLNYGEQILPHIQMFAKKMGTDSDHLTLRKVRDSSNAGDKDAKFLMSLIEGGGTTEGRTFDKLVVDAVHKGEFKYKSMADIGEALEVAKRSDINFDKDRNFAKLREVYQEQEKQAEMEELEAKKLKYDPSQVISQYTDASRTTDAMARQGFFIGSQVDVQDVNKDILAEVKKIVPVLSKMASEEVGLAKFGLTPDSSFK